MILFIETIRNYAWLLVCLISLAVVWLTYMKMSGKRIFRIGYGLFRAVIFFLIFYNPLLRQPRLPGLLVFPVTGLLFLGCGLTLNGVGIKELVKTKLGGVKGIPEQLITTGPYRIIRHPVNLGFMLIFCGWYLLWGGIYSLFFLPVLIILFIIVSFYEERNLSKVFGDQYRAYRQAVGMFIPRVWHNDSHRKG